MPYDRSSEMLGLIIDGADDFYAKHGHYPARVRVGPTVAGFLLKAGERQARIALRPGGTTLWITVVADSGLGPVQIVVES